MALAMYFNPTGMTAANYRESLKGLEAAGAGAPPGRLYHFCFGEGDNLQVFDIWESEADFQKFGESLMPVLQGIGIDPGQPMIAPVENIIVG